MPGLGLISGRAYHLRKHLTNELKITHIGWNNVRVSNSNVLTQGFDGEMQFYFVYSFFVRVENEQNSIMKCNYGINFDAAVCQDNIFRAPFHLEKSHKYGMKFLKNFTAQ